MPISLLSDQIAISFTFLCWTFKLNPFHYCWRCRCCMFMTLKWKLIRICLHPTNTLFTREWIRLSCWTPDPSGWRRQLTHPIFSYVQSAGTFRITTTEDKLFNIFEEQGSNRWLGAVSKHSGENTGKIPVYIVFMEIKSATTASLDINTLASWLARTTSLNIMSLLTIILRL